MPDNHRETRADRLGYIQSMLGQLRTMAEAERCDLLTYLIEMAYIEASDAMLDARFDARAILDALYVPAS